MEFSKYLIKDIVNNIVYPYLLPIDKYENIISDINHLSKSKNMNLNSCFLRCSECYEKFYDSRCHCVICCSKLSIKKEELKGMIYLNTCFINSHCLNCYRSKNLQET